MNYKKLYLKHLLFDLYKSEIITFKEWQDALIGLEMKANKNAVL